MIMINLKYIDNYWKLYWLIVIFQKCGQHLLKNKYYLQTHLFQSAYFYGASIDGFMKFTFCYKFNALQSLQLLK
jgi:hypothetical protein